MKQLSLRRKGERFSLKGTKEDILVVLSTGDFTGLFLISNLSGPVLAGDDLSEALSVCCCCCSFEITCVK